MNIDELIKTFTKYVDTYDKSIDGIILKYNHSIRVMNLSKYIAKSINLSDKDIEISILAGLLHDYGRFPQLEQYQTYTDLISIDHADVGCEMLFEKGHIKNYTEDVGIYDELYDAIKYHNKLAISDTVSDHNRVLCKVVRDADKVDILYLAATNKIRNNIDGEISEKVKQDFNNQEQVLNSHIKTLSDEIIVRLSLIYDINYNCSLKIIKENRYIEKAYDLIEDKETFKYYFDKILEYIEKRLGE